MLTIHRRSRGRGDEGIVIVMALAVSAIAFVVMAGILAQAIHNVVLSGYGRKRLAAVNAAEAGLNWYANQINTSNVIALGTASFGWDAPSAGCVSASTVPGSCWYVFAPTSKTGKQNPAATVATVPETATFEVRVLYTSTNPCRDPATGAARQCSLTGTSGVLVLQDAAGTPFPDTAYAVIRSTGTVGGIRRTLESYVRIRAIRENLQGGLAAISLCLGSAAKVTVLGNLAVNNEVVGRGIAAFAGNCDETNSTGDIYVGTKGGSLTLTPSGDGGGTLSVRGGGVVVEGNAGFKIGRDVWTEGAIVIGAGTPSSLSSCPTSGTIQCIGGDAIGSSVTLGSNAYVAGDTVVCDPACPPPAIFPELTWNAADWKSPWVIQEVPSQVSMANLLSAISAATTPTVFHIDVQPTATTAINDACDVVFDAKTVTVNTNVAIVSSCRFVFWKNSSTVQGSGALMLISAAPATGAESTQCLSTTSAAYAANAPYGPRDIIMRQNPTITTGLFVYTPCVLWVGNNQSNGGEEAVKGQFAARFIVAINSVTMTEASIAPFVSTIPGQITRFYQDVKFVREIPSSVALGNLPL